MKICEPRFRIVPPLHLANDEVHLWQADLGQLTLHATAEDEAEWRRVLSPDECARADRFRFSRDRTNFMATRALLRIILASY